MFCCSSSFAVFLVWKKWGAKKNIVSPAKCVCFWSKTTAHLPSYLTTIPTLMLIVTYFFSSQRKTIQSNSVKFIPTPKIHESSCSCSVTKKYLCYGVSLCYIVSGCYGVSPCHSVSPCYSAFHCYGVSPCYDVNGHPTAAADAPPPPSQKSPVLQR